MNPKECRYTKEHEWIRPETGGFGKVGITNYAQSQLGDIVFLALPNVGTRVEQFQKMGEIESVKAVSDLFTPVSGQILEINQAAANKPELVNQDPYGAGWLVRLKLSNLAELDKLMPSAEYDQFEAKLTEDSSH
ncbi:MAG: glycine cleavage system protein GcvH [Dehalococcoidales bacterium]|nr:glycine cleavage system protein GcvH [Dehalococcoidales bacterium]